MKKGILPLLAAACAWSWPSVMIRMLKPDFDIYTQNFFRYLAASIFLSVIGILFMRKKLLDAVSSMKLLLIPAIIMSIHQVFFTTGVFKTSAVMSSLLGRLNAVIIPALSCIFYEDERKVVINRHFIIGALVSFIGVTGVIIGRGSNQIEGFGTGALFIIIATTCWSIYAVYIKKLVRSVDPIAIITFVSIFSTIVFFPIAYLFGDIPKITHVSTEKQILLLGSGILGVGIGNIFYYHAVKHVGTSISAVFFLLMPLSVGFIGFMILGETLTMMQMVSGSILIAGCWIVTKLAKNKSSRAAKQKGSL
ncbi:EamA family transporter [Candidatus Poribacteria bacterium]|nr:EamA family transporter [Candidatus Poribacteria bacterium]